VNAGGYPQALIDYEDLAIDAYSARRPYPHPYSWGSDEEWHWVPNTEDDLELTGVETP